MIVLEARDRVGGRGHTIMAAPDITFDLGCGWLHSADKNSFVGIAEQLNFEVDKTPPAMARAELSTTVFPQKERADFINALDAFHDRAEEAAKSGRDSACEPLSRAWQPLEPDDRCDLDLRQRLRTRSVSILDIDAYEDTEINWRVRRGYGALMAAYGAHCPLALNTQVTLIDHSGSVCGSKRRGAGFPPTR